MKSILSIHDLIISNLSGNFSPVSHVDLELFPGEILVLVGESGCGKSMFCKSITGILPPGFQICRGEIRYRDIVVSNLSESNLQKIRGSEIATVFQNPMTAWNPNLAVGKQIADFTQHLCGCSKKQAKETAIALLQKVGISQPEQRFSQYPYEFSGGMLQRCVLAAAIAGNPSLLLLDEPTTALDTITQSEILQLLKKFQNNGLSMLFITHDLRVAAQIADRIAVMHQGTIVETGTPQQIFLSPKHSHTRNLLDCLPK